MLIVQPGLQPETGAIVFESKQYYLRFSSGITLDTGSPTISVNTSGFQWIFLEASLSEMFSDTSSFTVEGSTH
jgi:hypothetical protein